MGEREASTPLIERIRLTSYADRPDYCDLQLISADGDMVFRVPRDVLRQLAEAIKAV